MKDFNKFQFIKKYRHFEIGQFIVIPKHRYTGQIYLEQVFEAVNNLLEQGVIIQK